MKNDEMFLPESVSDFGDYVLGNGNETGTELCQNPA